MTPSLVARTVPVSVVDGVDGMGAGGGTVAGVEGASGGEGTGAGELQQQAKKALATNEARSFRAVDAVRACTVLGALIG